MLEVDMYSDCDDAGALALANALDTCGYAELKGVLINTRSKYSCLAASAINTFFGNEEIPIAALKPLTDEHFFDTHHYRLGEFASKVAHNYPHALDSCESTPSPVELYTTLLGSTLAANSVTIISIGFLTNLAALLSTPTGPELIASKVRELVVMGGSYPSGWEYNFGGEDPESAAQVLRDWPKSVPITFSGYELGKSILSGHDLKHLAPADSPVLAAYEWYVGRGGTVRESWDPVTVLYGVMGLEGLPDLALESPFQYGNQYGYNSIVSANGSNAWVYDESVTNQHWLELKEGVSNASIAWTLDQMYAFDPRLSDCPLKWAALDE